MGVQSVSPGVRYPHVISRSRVKRHKADIARPNTVSRIKDLSGQPVDACTREPGYNSLLHNGRRRDYDVRRCVPWPPVHVAAGYTGSRWKAWALWGGRGRGGAQNVSGVAVPPGRGCRPRAAEKIPRGAVVHRFLFTSPERRR